MKCMSYFLHMLVLKNLYGFLRFYRQYKKWVPTSPFTILCASQKHNEINKILRRYTEMKKKWFLYLASRAENKTDDQWEFSKVKMWPYLVNVDIIKLLWFKKKTKFLAFSILSWPKSFNHCNYFYIWLHKTFTK